MWVSIQARNLLDYLTGLDAPERIFYKKYNDGLALLTEGYALFVLDHSEVDFIILNLIADCYPLLDQATLTVDDFWGNPPPDRVEPPKWQITLTEKWEPDVRRLYEQYKTLKGIPLKDTGLSDCSIKQCFLDAGRCFVVLNKTLYDIFKDAPAEFYYEGKDATKDPVVVFCDNRFIGAIMQRTSPLPEVLSELLELRKRKEC